MASSVRRSADPGRSHTRGCCRPLPAHHRSLSPPAAGHCSVSPQNQAGARLGASRLPSSTVTSRILVIRLVPCQSAPVRAGYSGTADGKIYPDLPIERTEPIEVGVAAETGKNRTLRARRSGWQLGYSLPTEVTQSLSVKEPVMGHTEQWPVPCRKRWVLEE